MRYLLILLLSVLMLGCPAALYAPVSKSLTVPEAPDAAYQRATLAMQRLGGQLTLANKDQRVLSAVVKNAVVLNVSVVPADTGSTIAVSGNVLPNKVILGSFDEVDHYLVLLQ